MNRSQIEKMLMASGGITGEPVLSARFGSYASSVGKGNKKTTTSAPKSNVIIGKSGPRLKAAAEAKLDSLVNKARGDRDYANRQGAGMNYETAYDLAPASAKKFVDRQLKKTGGRLNEAAKARLNSYLTDRTQYQLDLDKFRKSSPQAEAAYVKRFPKTAAFEKLLRKGAEGVIGLPGRIIKKAADTYLDGVQNMIEKISGVDAKNVEIAKDKDTDIDTIVNNLQRNIKKERDEDKAKGVSEADLTAMYGDPIDIETGDDIFGGDSLNAKLLEDDSPLNVGSTTGIAQSEAEQKKLEGDFTPPPRKITTEPPGDETVADTQGLTPIRLDKFAGTGEGEGLFDLSGSDEPGQISAFDLDPNKSYFDLETGRVITPDKQESIREFAATEQMLQPFNPNQSDLIDQGLIEEQFKAQREGFPDIDVTQEQPSTLFNTTAEGERDLTRNPVPGQAVINGVGLVYADGSPIMEQGPTPLFDSEILDDETIRKAIEGKADGGQIFGNQNMSTFDKLKAIADGIADNK